MVEALIYNTHFRLFHWSGSDPYLLSLTKVIKNNSYLEYVLDVLDIKECLKALDENTNMMASTRKIIHIGGDWDDECVRLLEDYLKRWKPSLSTLNIPCSFQLSQVNLTVQSGSSSLEFYSLLIFV